MITQTQNGQFEEHKFFPPPKGLQHDFPVLGGTGLTQKLGHSPLLNPPPAVTFKNFRMSPKMISLMEGNVEIPDSSFTSTGVNKMITTYRDTSRNDIIFINHDAGGGNVDRLKLLNMNTSAVTTIFSFSAAFSNRYTDVHFRNRILMQGGDTTNPLVWYDPSTQTARKAGVAAPTGAPSGAAGVAGVPNGVYSLVYTYVNDQGHESNLSAAGSVTVASQKITWTIANGPTGTASKKLYRSIAGGTGEYFLVTTIADNTTTSFTDNVADSALGTLAETDNDVPPTNIAFMAADSKRVALLLDDGISIYFCKIDPDTGEPNWEAYPANLSLVVPFSGGKDKAKAIAFDDDGLYVFGALNTWLIRGDIGLGVKVERVFPGIGIFWPHSFISIPARGLMFFTQTQQLLFWNHEQMQDVGETIQATLNKVVAESGASGPNFAYDPTTQCVYMNFGLSGSAGAITDTLVYGMKTGEFSTATWNYNIMHYSPFLRNLYGSITADNDKIYGWWSGTTMGTTQLYTQKGSQPSADIEYIPFSPDPGYDVEYGWIEILLEAKPIVSSVLPTIKVSYSLDGGGTFVDKFVDVSRDFLVAKVGSSSVARSVRIPVWRTARTITLRIRNSTNSASNQNGIEMYKIAVWARTTRITEDKQREQTKL